MAECLQRLAWTPKPTTRAQAVSLRDQLAGLFNDPGFRPVRSRRWTFSSPHGTHSSLCTAANPTWPRRASCRTQISGWIARSEAESDTVGRRTFEAALDLGALSH